jgi:Ca2+-binding EF-hand superfamily protein
LSGRKAEIFEVFMQYDSDRNGYISYDEAHAILRDKLGFQRRQSESMLRLYDTNGDGQLSYDEFIRFYFKVQQKSVVH